MPCHTHATARSFLRSATRRHWLGAAGALALLAGGAAQATLASDAPQGWPQRLQAELIQIDARHSSALGVYVLDLDSRVAASYHADEPWYLASMVKVPVAIAILQAVDRGELKLNTQVTLRASDYVDGAGSTNSNPPGTRLRVKHLLEQMIVYSDNTASDMLIDLVGIKTVNEVVQSLVPQGFDRITTLGDVRRHAYGHLAPGAESLSGKDFLALKQQRTEAERLVLLGKLTATPPETFPLSMTQAYSAYYASGLNSGRLDAYGELLTLLAEGKTLSAESTAYLLKTMRSVQTGQRRIKAAFPPSISFAHKTGTQRARICDAGIASAPQPGGTRRVVIAACAKGDLSTSRSEQALKEVGEAVLKSGVLSNAGNHVPTSETFAVPGLGRSPSGR